MLSKDVISRVGQGTGFRSDLTASNTPPPPIVRSFLNIEDPISGGKSSAFETLESIFVSGMANTSKTVVSKKDCSSSVFPLMLLMLIEHSLMSLVLLVRLVNVGLDVNSGGPSSESVTDSVPDPVSDPVSSESWLSCKVKTENWFDNSAG